MEVIKFGSLQSINEHYICCYYVTSAIESEFAEGVQAICTRIKSINIYDTYHKRTVKSSHIKSQINTVAKALLKQLTESKFEYYKDLFAEIYGVNPQVVFESKKELIKIWTRNASTIIKTQIKSILYPPKKNNPVINQYNRIRNSRNHNINRIRSSRNHNNR